MSASQTRFATTARYAGWAALIAPITVLLHELGHYLVAQAFGYPATLGPSSVSGGAPAADAAIAGWQAAAGPLVSLALTALALLLIARGSRHPAVIVLALLAPGRSLVVAVWLGFQLAAALGLTQAGRPNFDEWNVAVAWGLPMLPVAVAAVAVMLAAWWYAGGHIARRVRWAALAGLLLGAFAGLWVWMRVVGPVVLG